jgi:hypothetical protein
MSKRVGSITADIAYDYYNGIKTEYSKQEIITKLGLTPDSNIIALFPNIPWDGQITGESSIFPQYRDFLKATVEHVCIHNNKVLVVRSHPAEKLRGMNVGNETTSTILNDLYPDPPKNLIVLPCDHEINSFTLARSAEFAIKYSSTISLELTHLKIPVVLAGDPPFRNKGIVYDSTSLRHYEELINQGILGKLKVSDEDLEILYRFVFYYYFQLVMPETVQRVRDGELQGFCYRSEADILSDPVLDYLYTILDQKKQPDFSEFYKLE